MRVLAVSVAPLFPRAVHGGSQRVLQEVALALGEAGHEVRLLCSARPENAGGFELAPRVRVDPTLPLSGAFPSPYEVAPYRLAEAAKALRDGAAWADRVYLHADAVFMRATLGGKSPIRSLHDFVYEEALLSALTLDAALTIVPSEYLRRCVAAALKAAGTRALEEVRVVSNGVAVPAVRPAPTAPPDVKEREQGDLVLLYPHRPDLRKGIRESLAVTAEVKRRLKNRRVRLLVAAHVDEQFQGVVAGYRAEVFQAGRELGVESAIEFFAWLPPERMAGLYAFADVTLCAGNFIESFGLVPLESVAAGTPAVCARVGALRELEGVSGLWHVPYGDAGAAADAVLRGAEARQSTDAGVEVIRHRFSVAAMRKGYVEAITSPDAGATRRKTGRKPAGGTRDRTPGKFELAPWCYAEGGRIYNDYEYGYVELPKLAAFAGRAAKQGAAFTGPAARKAGVPPAELAAARVHGVLIDAG